MIYSYHDCQKCQRGTPHTKRGQCVLCGRRQRKARRQAKRVTLGSPLQTHNQIEAVAGDLWSVVCRAEAEGCAYCKTPLLPHRLQWAHHYSRMAKSIKFHPDNWSAMCAPCHRRFSPFERDPEWERWIREDRLGEQRHDALLLARRVHRGLRTSDLQLLILEARQRIEALPAGVRRLWAKGKEATIMERLVTLGSVS